MGGYSDYQAARKKAASPAPKKSSSKKEGAPQVPDAPVIKMSGKQKHELEKLPGKMAALEEEIRQLRETLDDADLYTRDPAAFDAATRRFAKAQHELEFAESRWLELEEMRLQANV